MNKNSVVVEEINIHLIAVQQQNIMFIDTVHLVKDHKTPS